MDSSGSSFSATRHLSPVNEALTAGLLIPFLMLWLSIRSVVLVVPVVTAEAMQVRAEDDGHDGHIENDDELEESSGRKGKT